MSYKSLEDALIDLKKAGMLLTISEEVDPYLEMASIARQAYKRKAPAILFEKVKGSPFRAACNIFGTLERAEFLFRKEWKTLETANHKSKSPFCFQRTDLPYCFCAIQQSHNVFKYPSYRDCL